MYDPEWHYNQASVLLQTVTDNAGDPYFEAQQAQTLAALANTHALMGILSVLFHGVFVIPQK